MMGVAPPHHLHVQTRQKVDTKIGSTRGKEAKVVVSTMVGRGAPQRPAHRSIQSTNERQGGPLLTHFLYPPSYLVRFFTVAVLSVFQNPGNDSAGLEPTHFHSITRKENHWKIKEFFFIFIWFNDKGKRFIFMFPKYPRARFLYLMSHLWADLRSQSFALMELQKRQDQGQPERKGQKRKLEEEFEEEREISVAPSGEAHQALSCEVSAQVNILSTTFSWKEADRAAAKRATHVLAELAKNGTLKTSRSAFSLLQFLGFCSCSCSCSCTW